MSKEKAAKKPVKPPDEKVAKANVKKSSGKKTIALYISIGVLLLVFVFIWYFLPFKQASERLEHIKSILESKEYEKIIVTQANAYPSGSAAQIGKDFEKILEKDEESSLISAFLSSCQSSFPSESAIQRGGFWDIKITVITKDGRFIVYVDDQHVYLVDQNTRFNFTCSNSELYDLIVGWKK